MIVARLLIAAVFLTAAVTKARDPKRMRKGLHAFGVPTSAALPFGLALVAVEFATGIGALIPMASHVAGIAAVVLLALFSSAIAVNLVRGRRPVCNCFGQQSSKPIGPETLARNIVLGAIAATVAIYGATDLDVVAFLALSSIDRVFAIATLLSLGAFVACGTFARELLAQHGRILRRLEALEVGNGTIANGTALAFGLPIGSAAPAFSLPTLAGGEASLASLLAHDVPLMLVFGNPNCGPCEALLPDIAHWQREYASVLTVALVSSGTSDRERPERKLAMRDILLQNDREIAGSYQCAGTPGAMLVARDGTVASALAQGAEAIRTMLDTFLDGVDLHTAAPLPRRAIAVDALVPFLEGETLAITWSPQCGYCERMLPALRSWEREAGTSTPKILIVSTGNEAEHDAMDLRATIVRDPDRAIARIMETSGTPMARVIDAHGNVISDTLAGEAAIFSYLHTASATAAFALARVDAYAP